MFLLGDTENLKCRVRVKRKRPLSVQAIKGYLLVINPEKAFIYNVSTQHQVRVGMPPFLLSAGLDEIRLHFLSYQATALAA